MAEALDSSKFRWGGCQLGLAVTESLTTVDSVFGEDIAVELVCLFHLPVEWTGGGEESIN